MRTRFLAAAGAALALLTGCASQAATVQGAVTPTETATEQVVIRPVTSTGLPAPGFVVTDDGTMTLDCGPVPSRVATDDNIVSCSPSSADAVACWKDSAARTPGTPIAVLCYRDPWSVHLVRRPIDAGFPDVIAPSRPQPLGLLLDDGDHCLMRNGGVWNDLAVHPGWFGTYSCTGDGAVWTDSADGIDRSWPAWTVRTAPISGDGPLDSRRIVTAYFVGTHGT